jgi:hypothetical protein
MSECLMTMMSATAQYSHRTGVEVSFVRDENKKEACFSSAFVVFSLSRSRDLSLARSLSKSRLTSRRSREGRAFFGPLTYAWHPLLCRRCCLLLQDLVDSCAREGEEENARHVLWDTTSLCLCGLASLLFIALPRSLLTHTRSLLTPKEIRRASACLFALARGCLMLFQKV